MAVNPKSLKNLVRIKKGEVKNPEGGRAHNKEIKAIKRLTAAEVAEVGSLLLSKNFKEVQKIAKLGRRKMDSKSSILKTMIAGIACSAVRNNDERQLNAILDRLVGRVKETIELTGKNGGPVRTLVGAMTPEERMTELKKLRRMRKEAGDD